MGYRIKGVGGLLLYIYIIEFCTFDTKLDPQTTGTFTIEDIENNTISGKFQFKAKDQLGNVVNVESAEFNNVNIK